MNSWAEESPKTYPTVIVYQETEIPGSYKLAICYEFIYLNDFEAIEDPERIRIKKTLDKYATYEVEYEDAKGWRNRCYVNCSAANVLRHYDVAKKMNCRILYTKE
jgi:hypothetical protein